MDDNTTFAAECGDKMGLCVVSVLDPSAKEHEQQLDELMVLARIRSDQPLHFVWVDATRQPSFVEAFGLQRSDAPAAIALAAKKRRFKILPGAFDAKNLDSLLDGLLSGRERTMSIQVSDGNGSRFRGSPCIICAQSRDPLCAAGFRSLVM